MSMRIANGNGNPAFRSVVIFGGAGFIGSNLAHRLLSETTAKVHVFDNLSRYGVRHNLSWLQAAAGSSGRLRITIGDVRNERMVEQAVRHATEIYHLAAQVAVTNSLVDPMLDFEVNLRGTINVLEAARKSPHRPFLLFTSTNKVYGELGNPAITSRGKRHALLGVEGISESQPLDFHSPYGCSKGAADQYVHDYARIYDLPTVVFRMSCIAGPRQFGNEDQGWVAHFLYSALHGRPLTIFGDGRQVRDVLAIGDLLNAIEAVRTTPAAHGQVFNVGGGAENSISLLELLELIQNRTGAKPEFSFAPARPGDQPFYVTDFSKLTHLTGWRPEVSVAEALLGIFYWWRRNRVLFADQEEQETTPVPAFAPLEEAA
jgi:CDP-paratose 2-epimerase